MTLVPSSGLAFWLAARQRPVFGQGRPAGKGAGPAWAIGAQERPARRPVRRRAAGRPVGWLAGGPTRWLEVQAYTHWLGNQGQSVFVAHASDDGFGQGLNVGGASIATVGDGQDVHG